MFDTILSNLTFHLINKKALINKELGMGKNFARVLLDLDIFCRLMIAPIKDSSREEFKYLKINNIRHVGSKMKVCKS